MSWRKTDVMSERVKFIAAYLDGEASFTELCVDFGISRKTGYKWVERYEAGGINSMHDLSRAPKNHPHAVRDDVVDLIVAARKKHPRWGPRKLLVIIARHHPRLDLPVASTAGEILKRHGLVGSKKRKRRSSPYGDRLAGYDRPNAIWCADFKGHFPVDGKRCHPLTISDGYSRFLLRCKAMPRPLSTPSLAVFESAFREFGLPDAIRTDNGPPFSSLAPGGLSRLAIWWIKLGIRPERIMPGRPDQNGRHERMHSTLKAETAKPPRSTFRAQQHAFDRFRDEYNHVRPHEALGQDVPNSLFCTSTRKYPSKLLELEYPSHFKTAVTYPNGLVSFLSTQWYISGCLKSETVGLEEMADDRWKVYFGPVLLGLLDGRRARERGDRQFGVLVRVDGEVSTHRRRKLRRK
jgi:putative transposase